MELNSPVTELKGVGDELARKLAILGVHTVNDLIDHYPRRYEDYSNVTKIKDLKPGTVTIEAEIKQVSGRYVRRGMHITEAIASDETSSVRLVWFNQPYRAGAIKHGVKYFIGGEYQLSRNRFSILNPSVELVSDFPVNTARIIPVYRETKGLKSAQIRKLVREAIMQVRDLPEHLPDWILKEEELVVYARAVTEMHFPSGAKALATAQKRLGFEEVFELSLAALLNKKEFGEQKGLPIPFNEQLARDFVGKLPFKLTNAQRRVVWQIYQDMAEAQPMNRLVEGDVGSGKTVVAAMAALMVMSARPSDLDAAQGNSEERAKSSKSTLSEQESVIDAAMRQKAGGVAGSAGKPVKPIREPGEQGFQVALMAPTEILARQHAETLYKLLDSVGYGSRVGLLVGSLKPRAKSLMHAKIKSGEVRLIVGTHALISEKVDMHNLGLIIVDEQHRFGVDQRKKLQAKAGHMPHVLHMTATPIPRSLALTLYGELDICVLDELPPGRQPIETKIVSPNSKKTLYAKLDKELEAGRQIFVVCPLISEGESKTGLSAEETYSQLSEHEFKHRRVALLHGRMKATEKEQVMQAFLDHKYDILVSTTVVEVGVDVPNATIMLIMGAERFGLAQAHQLRGRVGRGAHQSYCYLMMSDSKAPSQRLRKLEGTSDGFKLAEYDLQLRGPGAIYGTIQHGALDLRVAKLTDVKLIAAARSAAQKFIGSEEKLSKYSHLSSRVNALRAVTNLN
ncbi:MAG TPA: ATP-dependent DNA helicase RecG [Candidatus Saccharimonadales bacterium]|nr:ATP-dependent DNA helicase RecG [Candidatus Saccharimonadales bacterium]